MSEHRAAPQTWWCCSADYPNHEPNCPNAAPQEGETPGAPIVPDEDVPTPLAAESGPRPEEEAARIREKYERVKEAHRDGALTVFNPEHNASWVDIATLLDQLQTLREEIAQLRYLDGRLNKAGREQFDRAEEAEAKLAAAQEEIAQLSEELTANRACNLYTWKERAERAEQSLREKDAEIEAEREAFNAQIKLWQDAKAEADERERTLREALDPLVDFIRKFDAKPLSNLGDEFYGIHTGTEWEASLRLSDFRTIAALLSSQASTRGE